MSGSSDSTSVTRLPSAHETDGGLDAERARLRKREETHRTMPDYGHFIVTRPGSEKLERRMNRKMREMKSLDPANDSERIRALREDIAILASRVFKIVGRGVTGDFDNTYDDILIPTMESFDASRGTPFSWYFRRTYALRRKDSLNASDQFNHDAPFLDDVYGEPSEEETFSWVWKSNSATRGIEGGRDAEIAPESVLRKSADYEAISSFDKLEQREKSIYDVYGQVDLDDLSREQIAAAEDASQAAVFIQAIALQNSFLDHIDDGVAHTPQTRMYRRMFFTEELTFIVKRVANFEECRPLQRHEREAFDASEPPFQDRYTVGKYRSIKALWEGSLRESVGSTKIRKIKKPGDEGYDETAVWKLPNVLFQDYIEDAFGVRVGGGAISNQRENYRQNCGTLRRQLGM